MLALLSPFALFVVQFICSRFTSLGLGALVSVAAKRRKEVGVKPVVRGLCRWPGLLVILLVSHCHLARAAGWTGQSHRVMANPDQVLQLYQEALAIGRAWAESGISADLGLLSQNLPDVMLEGEASIVRFQPVANVLGKGLSLHENGAPWRPRAQ